MVKLSARRAPPRRRLELLLPLLVNLRWRRWRGERRRDERMRTALPRLLPTLPTDAEAADLMVKEKEQAPTPTRLLQSAREEEDKEIKPFRNTEM